MSLKNLLKEPFELPEAVLGELGAHAELVAFGRNEVMVRQGSADDSVYVIASGLARIYHRPEDDDTREENLMFGGKGELALSPVAFFLGQPSAFGVAAVTRLRAYRLPGEVIRSLYAADPDFCRWLLIRALHQLAILEVRNKYLAPRDAYRRYLNFIRFKKPSFMRRVPGYHIASYLNISQTTLSLLRARYARDDQQKIGYDKEFLDEIGIDGIEND